MKELGLGSVLGELKNKIQKTKRELKKIEDSFNPLPEVIESTNLLRENESFRLVNNKKTELISAYENYTKRLEDLVSTVFEIQNDLKDIVQTQAEIINSKKTRKKHSKTKNIKKRSKPRSKRKTR